MTMTHEDAINPVHYPTDPKRFEFDEEVAAIFDNMATRSIPLYRDAHRVHAMLAETYINQQFGILSRKNVNIYDVGASVGGFLGALCHRYGCDPQIGIDRVSYQAVDASPAMVEEFKRQYPWAKVACAMADTPFTMGDGVDIVCMMYVLQFIPPDQRDGVLQCLYDAMRPNGMIFLGQKEAVDKSIEPSFTWEYIRWRMDNGYTKQEITAKTQALESVMWPETIEDTRIRLERVGFRFVRETTRWLQFSTLVARK